MATRKSDDTTTAPANADVQAFLTDPKHQQQRDFMTALIDLRLAEKINEAKTNTHDKGGSFLDNFFDGLTGNLFDRGDK